MLGSATKGHGEVDGPSPPSPELSSDLSETEVFEILSNIRRRYALHYLINNGRTNLGSLAERVAAWEYDKSPPEVSSAERKRVYCALQQSHLPKMDDAEVVEFDKRRGVVEPTDAAEELDIYLDVVRRDEIPWSEYYLGLSAVAVAFVVAVWVGVYPFVLLPEIGSAALLAVAFSLSALAHFLHARKMKLGGGGSPPGVESE